MSCMPLRTSFASSSVVAVFMNVLQLQARRVRPTDACTPVMLVSLSDFLPPRSNPCDGTGFSDLVDHPRRPKIDLSCNPLYLSAAHLVPLRQMSGQLLHNH